MTDAVAQLEMLLQMAAQPTNETQQKVRSALDQLSQQPQYKLWLLALFTAQNKDVYVRQRAGLLLKNVLVNCNWNQLDQTELSHIKEQIIISTQDRCREVRETGGSVLTTILQRIGGVGQWPEAINTLVNNLDNSSLDIVDGSFSALSKICEDFIEEWRRQWDPLHHAHSPNNDRETPPFILYASQHLLPILMQKANLSQPPLVRRYCLELLNHFALNQIFETAQFRECMFQYVEPYLGVIGTLARDDQPEVLANVCRGMCYLVQQHHQLLEPSIDDVLQFMMKFSTHPTNSTKLQALEFWTSACHVNDYYISIKKILKDLVPIIIVNLRYTDDDYMSMQAVLLDDAEVPDREEDIAPRFHAKRRGIRDGEDEDEDAGTPWGSDWTPRKAAATALDNLAAIYQNELLEIVLPLIEERLKASDDWEAQESAVLALGAIAYGCLDGLKQYLPKVMELLMRNSESDRPLLRSICCWCMSRYSEWICREAHYDDRKEFLVLTLRSILLRVLDRNKSVQEAACSAFANLEEEARTLLVPYLDDILKTLNQAFSLYQRKNLLHLYDVCGTLAEAVGSKLDKPEYLRLMMTPLLEWLQRVGPRDRGIIPLFSCLSSIAQHLGKVFLPFCSLVVERCGLVINELCIASKQHRADPHNTDKVELDAMAAALDLLAGIVEGLGPAVQEVLAQQNFVNVLVETVKETDMPVKQSTFALMGDCAKYCSNQLASHISTLIPECATCLLHHSPSVSNNASWAIGETCVNINAEILRPYLPLIVTNLLKLLNQARQMQRRALFQNACITFGRLGLVFGQEMSETIPHILEPWCVIMREYRQDDEKVTAFLGFCNMMRYADQAQIVEPKNVIHLLNAIGSLCPNQHLGEKLITSFRDVIKGYQAHFSAQFPSIIGLLNPDAQNNLKYYIQNGPSMNGNH